MIDLYTSSFIGMRSFILPYPLQLVSWFPSSSKGLEKLVNSVGLRTSLSKDAPTQITINTISTWFSGHCQVSYKQLEEEKI